MGGCVPGTGWAEGHRACGEFHGRVQLFLLLARWRVVVAQHLVLVLPPGVLPDERGQAERSRAVGRDGRGARHARTDRRASRAPALDRPAPLSGALAVVGDVPVAPVSGRVLAE